jgi:prolipoprotein diacylglyceryltransferase/protein-S-isoprenylcysteine O-methyltransferase Ste14
MTSASSIHDHRARPIRLALALAYAALFALVLPLLLVAWMIRLDLVLELPPFGSPALGVGLLLTGAAVVASGVLSLWRHGGGLPMSPFPPPRLASRGAYAIVADPIYVGSALLCAGVSVAIGSAAGALIVTPVFAAAMVAFVVGYERASTTARFGPRPRPLLHLPEGALGRLAADVLVAAGLVLTCSLLVPLGSPARLCVAIGAACVAFARRAVWRGLCRATEAIANSWREWSIGPVRFLSHGIYAGVGAAAGVALAVSLAGPRTAWWLIALAVVAEIGAATWAQVVEGSSQLLRPFGYFGSLIAVVVAAPLAWIAGADPWLLLAAFAAGACVTQAFGRLRCLVQGCCHGRPCDASWGIRYQHPRSRVLRLSDLGGVPVHPTQLYAILSSLVACAVLVRLWTLAVPLSFIAGTYLVIMGLTRFVEEHYRGEPQTARVGGLRLYQWLAIACVAVGAATTTVGGAPAPRPAAVSVDLWGWLFVLGAITYAAYGIDFPRSSRRFSRLV